MNPRFNPFSSNFDFVGYSGGDLTVSGNLSATSDITTSGSISSSNVIYGSAGNSTQWNSAYVNQVNYLPLSGGTLVGSVTANGARGELIPTDLFHNIPSQVILTNSGTPIIFTRQTSLVNGRYSFYNSTNDSMLSWNGSSWTVTGPPNNTILISTNNSSDILQGTWTGVVAFTNTAIDLNTYKYIDQLDLNTTVANTTATLLPTSIYQTASAKFVKSDTSLVTSTPAPSALLNIVALSQVAYDSLSPNYSSTTLYVIV